MNYYPFNVGDYSAHTGHLEPMEDLAYRRLLDQYYLHEGPLPCDIQATAKLVRMRSMASDVESVLKEFFELTEAGWMHTRCEQEIAEMQERQSIAKAKANKRWDMHRAELSNAAAMPQHTKIDAAALENDAGAMLPTPTPTPTPTPKEKNTSAVAQPVGLSDSVWIDFCEHRKNKKARLTQTAMDGILSEIKKAGWSVDDGIREICIRNWVAFKAEWVEKSANPSRKVCADAWWEPAGFDTEWDARNNQCEPSTAKFFRDGKRIAQAVA